MEKNGIRYPKWGFNHRIGKWVKSKPTDIKNFKPITPLNLHVIIRFPPLFPIIKEVKDAIFKKYAK